MNAASVTAFADTFRVVIVAAAAGAVLGLALRRPRTSPALEADEGLELVEAVEPVEALAS
jgi:hypothetical protein